MSSRKDTICCKCKWSAGKDKKCPWAAKFEPVPGWEATPTKVRADVKSVHKTIDSFIVHECPLFELLKMQKAEIDRAAERKWLKLLMEVEE